MPVVLLAVVFVALLGAGLKTDFFSFAKAYLSFSQGQKMAQAYNAVASHASLNNSLSHNPIDDIPLSALLIKDGFSENDIMMVNQYEQLLKYQIGITPLMTDVDCSNIPASITLTLANCTYIKTKLQNSRFMQVNLNGTVDLNTTNQIVSQLIDNNGKTVKSVNSAGIVSYTSQNIYTTPDAIKLRIKANAKLNDAQIQAQTDLANYAANATIDLNNTSSSQNISITSQNTQYALNAADTFLLNVNLLQLSQKKGIPNTINTVALISYGNSLKNTSFYTSNSTFKATIDSAFTILNSLQ